MLEHLDDPNPPRPSELTVERIAAEGARRLRRRRLAAGGALVVASTLAVVGMAVAVQPGDPDKVDTVGPGSTTTIADDGDDAVPPAVDDTTTTTPGGDDETAGPPPTGDAAPPGDVDDATRIAAVVKDPNADQALVVLLDPFTGAVTRNLASYALTSRPPLCCVELGDGGAFYVVPAGQGSGDPEDTIWHVDLDGGQPAPMTAGTNPALSPDGDRLAFVRTSSEGPAVVVLDLANGNETTIPAAVDDYLRDIEWYDDDTVIVTRQQPESALEGLLVDLDAATLADATRLGPDGAPSGTSWEWLDRRPDGLITVAQTCCSRDAGSIAGESSYALIDPATGTYDGGSDLPFHPAGLATAPTSDRELLVDPPDDSPGYGTLVILMDTDLTPVPGDHQVIAADW